MTVKQLRKTYQIKIYLVGSKPPIWRRIQVPNNISLTELHHVFQDTMGWFDYHLHQFEKDGIRYGTIDEEFGFDDELKNEEEYKLSQLLTKEKDSLQYEYDFGDGWEHKVTLEKILPFDPENNSVVCVDGRRACPPEDCGGIWGYQNLIDVLGDPKHPEYEDMLDWVGGEFNPELFDIAETNEILNQNAI